MIRGVTTSNNTDGHKGSGVKKNRIQYRTSDHLFRRSPTTMLLRTFALLASLSVATSLIPSVSPRRHLQPLLQMGEIEPRQYTPQQQQQQRQQLQRRRFLGKAVFGSAAASLVVATNPSPSFAAQSKEDLAKYLAEVKEAIADIPQQLEEEKWDAIRTTLKIKCGNLWNLGDAKNPVVQFAKEEGELDLLELAEELGTAFQLCDQFTYDNVFIKFQPGSGKTNIKDPTNQIQVAGKKLDAIIGALKAL